MTTYSHCFRLLNRWVEVETDDHGTTLVVTFDSHVIERSSGYCVEWPFKPFLAGAARKAFENKVLREAGEAAICRYLETPQEQRYYEQK